MKANGRHCVRKKPYFISKDHHKLLDTDGI